MLQINAFLPRAFLRDGRIHIHRTPAAPRPSHQRPKKGPPPRIAAEREREREREASQKRTHAAVDDCNATGKGREGEGEGEGDRERAASSLCHFYASAPDMRRGRASERASLPRPARRRPAGSRAKGPIHRGRKEGRGENIIASERASECCFCSN